MSECRMCASGVRLCRDTTINICKNINICKPLFSAFLGREKNNVGVREILQLKKADGNITANRDEIANTLNTFWGELYTKKSNCMDIKAEFIKELPQVTAETFERLEYDITVLELTNSVMSTKTGKSPGQDGLSVAFYQKFWDNLKFFFTRLTMAIYSQNALPQNMNTGILRQLPKLKKDLLDVKSWRPICLQGVDVKIILKTLS